MSRRWLSVVGFSALSLGISLAWACPALAATFYQTDFETPANSTHASCFNPSVAFPPRATGSGSQALRFRFFAGFNSTHEEWCHFTAPHREIYMRYWLRVPSNFRHLWQACCGGNNKLFAIWMDGYSDQGRGPTVVWEFWPSESTPLGGSDLSVHWSEGNFTPAGLHHQFTPFISYPSDQGRWMQIVLHVKAASSASSADGVIELWRRWEHQSSYSKLHDVRNANIAVPPTGPNGWKTLYTMGWSNPGYLVDTDFYMDDVEIADSAFPELLAPLFANGYE